jgi:hypothetical protein
VRGSVRDAIGAISSQALGAYDRKHPAERT